MNREEATALLKEINVACDTIGEQGIMLMPPDADDVLSHGYQLHIKTVLSSQTLKCIRAVVEKQGLSLANEPDKNLVIIYRPTSNVCPVCKGLFNSQPEMESHKAMVHSQI